MSVHYDREIERLLGQLTPGVPIVTADGDRIGTLSETRNRFLKVDAPMRRDFWIDVAFVASCDLDRINLTFEKSDLGAYRVSEPGGAVEPLDYPSAADRAPLTNLTQPGMFADPAGAVAEPPSAGHDAGRVASQGDPLVAQQEDLIVSAEEQLEQRMRMEAQLAEQRQKLDHMHPIGEGAPPDTFGTVGEPVETELARLEAQHGPITSSSRHIEGDVPKSRWLIFVGVAALLGVAGAAVMIRRHARSTRRGTAARVQQAVTELPVLAERSVNAARGAMHDLPEVAERGVSAARTAVAARIDRAREIAERR